MSAAREPHEVCNFAPGPAKLPEEVIAEAQIGAKNYNGLGIGVMEMSHRSKEFSALVNETTANLRDLLKIPDNYKILLLQGGGTGQFAGIPLNISKSSDDTADYFVTGTWSAKAAKEAEKYVKVNRVLPKTTSYVDIADKPQWSLTPNASYVYYCDNETVHGIEFPYVPDVGDVPLVCDMSSNFLSRPVDVSKFAVIYAGAQKNIGCAGVTVVIVREDMLGTPRSICPVILDYTTQAGMNSLYNTPPSWAIYILGLVLKWVKGMGGVKAMQERSVIKSKMVFDVINSSSGFYTMPVLEKFRSHMNVPCRLAGGNESLEAEFVQEADKRGLLSLKGHRSVGGLRISLYNAVKPEEVKLLVTFMTEFMASHK